MAEALKKVWCVSGNVCLLGDTPVRHTKWCPTEEEADSYAKKMLELGGSDVKVTKYKIDYTRAPK